MMNKAVNAIKRILRSRSLRYGSNSIILIAAVVAIAVVINVLLSMTSLKWDLTSSKMFSIGDTTKKVLSTLKKDVTIYGLFDAEKAGSTYKPIKEMLEQYEKGSDKVSLVYRDPDKNPGFLKEIDPNKPEELKGVAFVVKSGTKLKKLTADDMYEIQYSEYGEQQGASLKAEQSFTGAIKYVSSEVTPTIYFTEGHKENGVDTEYKEIKRNLELNNYDIKTVNLITQNEVPADAEILVVASPKTDLNADEKDKIKRYLKKGGAAVFLFDSLDSSIKLTMFEDVLADYNISLNYDKIKEKAEDRHMPQNEFEILGELQSNDVNNFDTTGKYMVAFECRSLNILKNQKENLTVSSLMSTSDKAVGMVGNEEKIKGPLDLAVAAEYKGYPKSTKVLVVGNGYFMSDAALGKYGTLANYGMSYFLYWMNWMQDKSDDTVIAPKANDTKMLEITEQQSKLASFFVVAVLPLVILGLGTFVWMRRRHL